MKEEYGARKIKIKIEYKYSRQLLCHTATPFVQSRTNIPSYPKGRIGLFSA